MIKKYRIRNVTHGLCDRSLIVVVGEGGQQVLPAVVLVAVDHDLTQRVRPRHL